VIHDRVNGRVVESEEELVDAVDSLSSIDRGACRADAEKRFSPRAMAAAYERVYAGLVSAQVIDVGHVLPNGSDREVTGLKLEGFERVGAQV
jgi:hypothetical protein